jgi:hypothetical protein
MFPHQLGRAQEHTVRLGQTPSLERNGQLYRRRRHLAFTFPGRIGINRARR